MDRPRVKRARLRAKPAEGRQKAVRQSVLLPLVPIAAMIAISVLVTFVGKAADAIGPDLLTMVTIVTSLGVISGFCAFMLAKR